VLAEAGEDVHRLDAAGLHHEAILLQTRHQPGVVPDGEAAWSASQLRGPGVPTGYQDQRQEKQEMSHRTSSSSAGDGRNAVGSLTDRSGKAL